MPLSHHNITSHRTKRKLHVWTTTDDSRFSTLFHMYLRILSQFWWKNKMQHAFVFVDTFLFFNVRQLPFVIRTHSIDMSARLRRMWLMKCLLNYVRYSTTVPSSTPAYCMLLYVHSSNFCFFHSFYSYPSFFTHSTQNVVYAMRTLHAGCQLYGAYTHIRGQRLFAICNWQFQHPKSTSDRERERQPWRRSQICWYDNCFALLSFCLRCCCCCRGCMCANVLFVLLRTNAPHCVDSQQCTQPPHTHIQCSHACSLYKGQCQFAGVTFFDDIDMHNNASFSDLCLCVWLIWCVADNWSAFGGVRTQTCRRLLAQCLLVIAIVLIVRIRRRCAADVFQSSRVISTMIGRWRHWPTIFRISLSHSFSGCWMKRRTIRRKISWTIWLTTDRTWSREGFY